VSFICFENRIGGSYEITTIVVRVFLDELGVSDDPNFRIGFAGQFLLLWIEWTYWVRSEGNFMTDKEKRNDIGRFWGLVYEEPVEFYRCRRQRRRQKAEEIVKKLREELPKWQYFMDLYAETRAGTQENSEALQLCLGLLIDAFFLYGEQEGRSNKK
jgi:hypothetical protein